MKFCTGFQVEGNFASHFEDVMGESGLAPDAVSLFQKMIYFFYQEHGPDFPWRKTHNPYHILVSEIMLQQTQTERVVE